MGRSGARREPGHYLGSRAVRNAVAAPLAAILSQLEGAAALKVRRKAQIVRLEVRLHDDVDEWADDGGGPTTEALWTALKAIGTALGGTWEESPEGAWASDPLLRAAREQERLSSQLGLHERELVWLPESYGERSFGLSRVVRAAGDHALTTFIEGLRAVGALAGVSDDTIRATLRDERNHGNCRAYVDVATLSHHVLLLDPRCESAGPAPWTEDHAQWARRVLALAEVEPSDVHSDYVAAEGFVVEVTLGGSSFRLNHGRDDLRDAHSRATVVAELNRIAEAAGRDPNYAALALPDCDPCVMAYMPADERRRLETIGVVELA